jgi:K+-sensing histidine kinase KdpD
MRWHSAGVSRPIVTKLRGLLAGTLMVAAVSGLVAFLDPRFPLPYLLVIYVLIVMAVAVVWGTGMAAFTAVLSTAAFSFVVHPAFSFHIGDPSNIVGLAGFLATAVVVGQLAARLRRAAVESARLSDEQSALRRVATLVASSAAPPAVFEAVTREVGLLCNADLARMERYEEDGTVTGIAAWTGVPVQLAVGTRFALMGPSIAREVRQTGGPARVASFTGAMGAIAEEVHRLGIRSSVGCPIFVAGRIWGVSAASTKSNEPFPADTESQIASFTELVATAIANAESRAELAASRARVVAAGDETQRRLERNLHHGAQQRLVSLVLKLRLVHDTVPAELPAVRDGLGGITRELTEVLEELRELARGSIPRSCPRVALVRRYGRLPGVQPSRSRCTWIPSLGIRRR